jgi:hypothetical protein
LLGGSKRKFVFIHINKCGGSSIIKSIWPVHKWHDTVKEVIGLIGEKEYHKLHSFTVVRNPWSKVVSQYNFRKQTNQNDLGVNPISFKEWLKKTYGDFREERYVDDPKMFQPQVEWLKDLNGEVSIDSILRFESLEEDYNSLKKELGLSSSLKHRNSSKKVDYSTYYDDESVAIISNFFREDIKLFGYQYDK